MRVGLSSCCIDYCTALILLVECRQYTPEDLKSIDFRVMLECYFFLHYCMPQYHNSQPITLKRLSVCFVTHCRLFSFLPSCITPQAYLASESEEEEEATKPGNNACILQCRIISILMLPTPFLSDRTRIHSKQIQGKMHAFWI